MFISDKFSKTHVKGMYLRHTNVELVNLMRINHIMTDKL